MTLLGVNSNVGNGNGTKDANVGAVSLPLRPLPTFKSLIPSSPSVFRKSPGMTLGYASEGRFRGSD